MSLRRIGVGAALVVALGAALTVSPTTAHPAEAHGYGTNGCSVPGLPQGAGDRGWGFDFHEACDQHDRCYVFHAAGPGEAGRKACDDMFYRLMQSSVWRMPWWNWHPVEGLTVAGAYYAAVRWKGKQPFEDANKWHRANVPVR